MSAVYLPTRTDLPRYSFDTELENVTYHFDFEWNERDSSWYMSIADVNLVPLLSGVRVVVGFILNMRYLDPRLPPGVIEAVDTSNAGIDPGFADLGDRVKLIYIETTGF